MSTSKTRSSAKKRSAYLKLEVLFRELEIQQIEVSRLVQVGIFPRREVGACDWHSSHRVLDAILAVVGLQQMLSCLATKTLQLNASRVGEGAAESEDLLEGLRSVDFDKDLGGVKRIGFS